ncbi:HVA22-like protein a [Euphorbia lathyris]|uniref:HVA22-like protein a n=1 Tax=Euphorbia lathyris TaxID=212925 RepID=UPI00331319A4
MDLMGLLFKFALESFHILAWPLVAIAYPLCASIQAIENNSNTKKLITYWICFSLILLFENAFQQLLHSFPYWPYMKLMIVGCLVTPQFDGSFYIYNHFVHPYLSMNPHFVFNWLIKLSDILKQDYPLTQAKRESKETERQALQNLVPSLIYRCPILI